MAYVALAVVIGKSAGSVEHIAYVKAIPYSHHSLTLAGTADEDLSQLSYIESTIYCPIIVTVKISILLQYITLFVTHRGSAFHYTVYCVIWTNVVFYTIVSLLNIFGVSNNVLLPLPSISRIREDAHGRKCNPRQKYWEPTVPGHCLGRELLGVATGVINVFFDFSILILPLPLIWRMQMSWAKKARVTAVFGVGLSACIASVIRLFYSSELVHISPTDAAYQVNVDRQGLWAYAIHCPAAGFSLPTYYRLVSPKWQSASSWVAYPS